MVFRTTSQILAIERPSTSPPPASACAAPTRLRAVLVPAQAVEQRGRSRMRGLLMAAAALALGLSAADAATTQCKTMSFNVRTSMAADHGRAAWKARRGPALEALRKHAPDFVGTQEATQEQYEFFRDNLEGYGVLGECAGPCIGANERVFIMYDAEKWDVIENGDFALSDTPEKLGSNTWGLEYNRMASWGRFQLKGDPSVTACVFNTHFDMSKGHTKSARLIVQRMSEICQPTDLTMLTGDLNTTPDKEAIQYLLAKKAIDGERSALPLVSAQEQAKLEGGTFIGSFKAPVGDTVFDYVFARGDDALCIESAELIDERFDGKNAISDHALITATFCLGDACTLCANRRAPTPLEAGARVPRTPRIRSRAPRSPAPPPAPLTLSKRSPTPHAARRDQQSRTY